MVEAVVAMGGNVGCVRTALVRAVDTLCDGRDVRLIARSSDYRTPPWGVADQPAFINLCIIVATELTPRALLDRAQCIEVDFGRNRAAERRWGPRTLDIDIIAYGEVAIDEPGVTLPHPHFKERAFVLAPLAEIAPDRVIAGVRVADALAQLDVSGIERLPPR
jgi:2-amino-4-hydroxy-6-hydroxymethyldihydropteridine diphosphokinase